tara:strand:- start:2505 stop:2657 length:153 start_codon:yes stop_codon:yes gene_type:complete
LQFGVKTENKKLSVIIPIELLEVKDIANMTLGHLTISEGELCIRGASICD